MSRRNRLLYRPFPVSSPGDGNGYGNGNDLSMDF